MKGILTILGIVLPTLLVSAQEPVPQEVNRAFAAQFPGGHLKKWEQKKEGYVATFRQKGKKCFAYYTSGGAWKATESPVKWTRDLPGPVRAGWEHCEYRERDWLILDIKKIELPGQTMYTIHVGQVQSLGPDDANIGTEYVLFFSEKGELIRKQRQ